MEASKYHNIFLKSESYVNPQAIYESKSWSMWLNLANFKTESSSLELKEVNSQKLWSEMFKLRQEIEKEFGEFEVCDISAMLGEIKELISNNAGTWFLAYENDQLVGEVGVLPITVNGLLYYRLQDVDILPKFRGKGLGKKLLHSIISFTKKNKATGICLRADENDWKKDWYSRFGFTKIGEVK